MGRVWWEEGHRGWGQGPVVPPASCPDPSLSQSSDLYLGCRADLGKDLVGGVVWIQIHSTWGKTFFKETQCRRILYACELRLLNSVLKARKNVYRQKSPADHLDSHVRHSVPRAACEAGTRVLRRLDPSTSALGEEGGVSPRRRLRGRPSASGKTASSLGMGRARRFPMCLLFSGLTPPSALSLCRVRACGSVPLL